MNIPSATQIEILVSLARYKYLCTSQVHKYLYRGKTLRSVQKALKRLGDLQWIERRRLPKMESMESMESFGNLCYLTAKGFQVVEAELEHRDVDVHYSRVIRPIGSTNHFYHRKRLIDFMILLDAEISEMPELSLKVLKTEARRPKDNGKNTVETSIESEKFTLKPDIAFVLKSEKNDKEAAFFVEIDTGKETIGGRFETAPDGSLLNKFLRYEHVQKSEEWRQVLDTTAQAFQVLTITEKERFMKTLSVKTAQSLKHPKLFLTSTFKRMEESQILQGGMWWEHEDQEYKSLL